MATLPPLEFDLSGIDVPQAPGGVNAASPGQQAYEIFKQNEARRAAFRTANGVTPEMLARANSFGAAPSVPVGANAAPVATAEAASGSTLGARAAAAGGRAARFGLRGLLGRAGLYASLLDGGYEAGKLLTPPKVAVGLADMVGTIAQKFGFKNNMAGGSAQYEQAQSAAPAADTTSPTDAVRTAGRPGGPALGDLDHELVDTPDHPLSPTELFTRDALRANAGDTDALSRVQAVLGNGGNLSGYGRKPVTSGSFTDANTGQKQVTIGFDGSDSLAAAQKAYEDAAAAPPTAAVRNARYLEARGRALDPSYQRARAQYDAGTVTPSLKRSSSVLGTEGGIFGNLADYVNNFAPAALGAAQRNAGAKLGVKQGELAVKANDSVANRENQAQNADSNRIKAYTELLKEVNGANKENVKTVVGLDGNPIIVDQRNGSARKVTPSEAPTWEKFRDSVKNDPRSKNFTDEQLKAYYNRTYGAGAAAAQPGTSALDQLSAVIRASVPRRTSIVN